MKHTWCPREVSDHAMVMVRVDFETIFKCPSELHLDISYQHIIHSTIRKWLIDSQPESEEKQRLLSIIESKLKIEFTLAQLRQETEDNEVAIGVRVKDLTEYGDKKPASEYLKPETFGLSNDDEQVFKSLSVLKDDPGFAKLNWFSHFRLNISMEKFSSRNNLTLKSRGVTLPSVKAGKTPLYHALRTSTGDRLFSVNTGGIKPLDFLH